MKCSKCGHENKVGSAYCTNCGAALSLAQVSHAGATAQKPQQRSIADVPTPLQARCPECGGHVNFQLISTKKRRSVGDVIVLILLTITLVGIPIMIVILMAGNQYDLHSFGVCQSCGKAQRTNQYIPY